MTLRATLALLALLFVSSIAPSARAHPLGFAVLSIDEIDTHAYSVVLRVSGSEADPGDLAATWPEDCVEQDLRETAVDEVRERRSSVVCARSLLGRTITVDGPGRGIELLVNARFTGGVETRSSSRALPAEVVLGAERRESFAVAHLLLGIEHFAFGIDHVLFVVGAFFLARRLGARAIVMVVSAFTFGHALTLALATLGVLVLSARPVEACIALSLVHVARELRISKDTFTRTRPALVCAVFGLVHGAGFARALAGAGLEGGDLAVGLVSFNVGLEIAQLALVLVLVAIFRGRLAKRAEPIAALVVGGVGAFLFLDRALALVLRA